EVFSGGSLNPLMGLGPAAWAQTRRWVTASLEDLPAEAARAREDESLVLPCQVADYVDFYSCAAHVAWMGRLLRPGEDPLPAAWRHIPIGYHGRAATVVVSGQPVRRPKGMVAGAGGPEFQPTA